MKQTNNHTHVRNFGNQLLLIYADVRSNICLPNRHHFDRRHFLTGQDGWGHHCCWVDNGRCIPWDLFCWRACASAAELLHHYCGTRRYVCRQGNAGSINDGNFGQVQLVATENAYDARGG